MKLFLCAACLLSALTWGCFPTGYDNHPSRREIVVNGYGYWVVPRDDLVIAGTVEQVFPNPSALKRKRDLISAIQQVTGCKVTDSEFQQQIPFTIFEAIVDCKK